MYFGVGSMEGSGSGVKILIAKSSHMIKQGQ